MLYFPKLQMSSVVWLNEDIGLSQQEQIADHIRRLTLFVLQEAQPAGSA